MRTFVVCVGLFVGLGASSVWAAPAIKIAQTELAQAAAPAPAAEEPAAAAPAKPKRVAKPKTAAAKKAPSAISVENKRTVTLKSLQISMPGDNGKLIGKLAKEVAGGKSGRVALKGAKGCEYQVKWEFEDAGDESTADLCNDPKIVLTD
jgi:P pilus assembly chaperone PapD